MQTLQSHTEHSTSFVVKKSVVIQVFWACISSGMGILEACRVDGTSMGFSECVVHRWAREVCVDFFGILTTVEDATYDRLERELESGCGKHPKWISFISDEALRVDLRKLVLDNDYKWSAKSDHTRCGIQAEADVYCGSVSRKSGVGLWDVTFLVPKICNHNTACQNV